MGWFITWGIISYLLWGISQMMVTTPKDERAAGIGGCMAISAIITYVIMALSGAAYI